LLGQITTKVTDAKHKPAKKKKQASKSPAGWQGIDERGPLADLSSDTLWDAITADVKQRYAFDLSEDRQGVLERLSKITVLRAVCKKVGIQVLAREYDFKLTSPVSADDVQSLYPVVKASIHTCKEAKQQLDAARGDALYTYVFTRARTHVKNTLTQVHMHIAAARCGWR
jgi:hypothetical protein